MNPTVVRVYQYLVALVAIHMVVLGAANLLRVVAEVALGAPSGGFTGLPFLFAEGGLRPLNIHREQLSLAIALVLVGGPAWYFHWRPADRAAQRSDLDRGSPVRSAYLQAVLFVTALLTLAYGVRTLTLALSALLLSSGAQPGFIEPEWPARAAGALAMALVAALTWWWHRDRADRDRRAGVGTKAAELRRVQTYLLMFISAFVVATSAIALLGGIWNALASTNEAFGPVVVPPTLPDRIGQIKNAVAFFAPSLVLGTAVWLLYAANVQRIARGADRDGAAERGSQARAIFLYVTVFISGLGALQSLASIGEAILQRLGPSPTPDPLPPLAAMLGGSVPPAFVLGVLWSLAWLRAGREHRWTAAEPAASDVRWLYLWLTLAIAQGVSLAAVGVAMQRLLRPVFGGAAVTITSDLSTPLPYLILFGGAWWYQRMVLRREGGAMEAAAHVAARLAYEYLFYLAAVALGAIGGAGAIGVLGSFVLGDLTHGPDEIATYVTLFALGCVLWTYHRGVAVGVVDAAERSAPGRRLAWSLAVLGGVIGLLVFGSGAVFRIVNAVLAFGFDVPVAHDLWHLLTDATVSLVVALFHWRILRNDRALAAPAVAPAPLILVLPTPERGMRDRLIRRFRDEGGLVYETDAATVDAVRRRVETAVPNVETARPSTIP